jgi:hypothetical protein
MGFISQVCENKGNMMTEYRSKEWVEAAKIGNYIPPKEEMVIGRRFKIIGVEVDYGVVYFKGGDDRHPRVMTEDNNTLSPAWCNLLPIESIEEASKRKILYIGVNTTTRLRNICGAFLTQQHILLRLNGVVGILNVPKTLNSSESAYIKNGTSGEFWLNGQDQRIKLGKILKVLMPQWDSTKIETAVSSWKSHYTVDTTTVEVSDDVPTVYDMSSVGGSCMAHKGSWCKIYEDLKCKIAYIPTEHGGITARMLLWEENLITDNGDIPRLYDRIFYDNENAKLTLVKWAEENGYRPFSSNEVYTTIDAVGTYDEVPYVDTMCYVLAADGGYKLTNVSGENIDILQCTNGGSVDDCGISTAMDDCVHCVDTDNMLPLDDAYYVDEDGEYYEYDDELVYIDTESAYYRRDSDSVVYAEDTQEYELRNNCTEAVNGDYYYYTDSLRLGYDDEYYPEDMDLVTLSDVDRYAPVCSDVYRYIQDLDEYWYNYEECYEATDLTWWSNEEAYIASKGE